MCHVDLDIKMNTPSDATHAQPHDALTEAAGRLNGRVSNIAVWAGQIVVGAFLFFSAIMKLTGAEEMVALFESIGIGQWFRFVTATIQVVGAALLVTPRLASAGALILASTMGGAVITHLFVIGGSALVPFVLFVLLLGIAWARRDRLPTR